MQHYATLLSGFALASLAALWPMGQPFAYARTPQADTNLCDSAAARAAEISGVPVNILRAIARVETGRKIDGVISPWPWAVNQAGSGSFFHTPAEAIHHVAQALATDQSNIDIGCFQLNIRWHGTEFPSLAAMFEPSENALYAAQFLLQLYEEFGTWDAAIGAYHSRQTEAATAYVAKVTALMASTDAITDSPVSLLAATRRNRYPLLQPGEPGGYGSLVATAFSYRAIPLIR